MKRTNRKPKGGIEDLRYDQKADFRDMPKARKKVYNDAEVRMKKYHAPLSMHNNGSRFTDKRPLEEQDDRITTFFNEERSVQKIVRDNNTKLVTSKKVSKNPKKKLKQPSFLEPKKVKK